MKNRKTNSGTLAILLLIVFVFAVSIVWARAGGSGGYGGSSGGGGGGGGGGIGYLYYILIRLAIEYPVIGVPLLIVATVLFIKFGKKAKGGHETRTISKARELTGTQDKQKTQDASIKVRDPAFSEGALLKRVDTAFVEIQKSWSSQDLSNVRQFISDGINERFSIQFDIQKEEGYRNDMSNIEVISSKIVGVECSDHFDIIHLEIHASANDRNVEISTGKLIKLNSSAPFAEYWTFLRKPGAKTLRGNGLIEGFCPNCGAPLELSDTGTCENCGSFIISGEYDWLLTEITQLSEWNIVDPDSIPGYAAIVRRDPGFSTELIEDTASMIFWRVMRSWFEHDTAPADKVALPSFLKLLEIQHSNASERGKNFFFYRPAVGAVEIQTITPGISGGMSKIEVLIKWSARNAVRKENGKIEITGRKTIRPEVFTLVRKHNVKTDVKQSFRSSHCPGCGAPMGKAEGGECEYCGKPLNDGSSSWILESVNRFTGSRLTTQSHTYGKKKSIVKADVLLASMVSAMYADGVIDTKETELLSSFAASRNIPPETLNEIITTAASGSQALPVPATKVEGREILAVMARMLIADEKLTSAEKSFLRKYGESQGLVWADVKLILAQEKTKLYREAKVTIRES